MFAHDSVIFVVNKYTVLSLRCDFNALGVSSSAWQFIASVALRGFKCKSEIFGEGGGRFSLAIIVFVHGLIDETQQTLIMAVGWRDAKQLRLPIQQIKIR